MTFIKPLFTYIASIALLMPIASQAQVEVKAITTRPGVTVKFVYAKAEKPIASVILMAGGSGVLGLFTNGSMRYENYTPTAIPLFVKHGFNVLLAEVPSDKSTLNGFRNTVEHAQDNLALMAFLKQQADVPVWAIGHSNGALSAAAFSTHHQEKGPLGLVLMAATTKAPFNTSSAHPVLLSALDQIKTPVLIVHNKLDPCPANPYSGVTLITTELKLAKKVTHFPIEATGTGGVCSGIHRFIGVEEKVTEQVADWIKATQAEIKP
jgi:dienelactone hydrolase